MIYVVQIENIPEDLNYSELNDIFYIENGEPYSLFKFLIAFNENTISTETQVVRQIDDEDYGYYSDMIEAIKHVKKCYEKGTLNKPVDTHNDDRLMNLNTVYIISENFELHGIHYDTFMERIRKEIPSDYF